MRKFTGHISKTTTIKIILKLTFHIGKATIRENYLKDDSIIL
tara:strand:+ start:129 stop:254 length:126 start_codon:yes stop_codon:yes gene_type:complete